MRRKRKEKRRLREEQRVRGVDLEGAKLTELPVMRNFSEGVPEGTVLGAGGCTGGIP